MALLAVVAAVGLAGATWSIVSTLSSSGTDGRDELAVVEPLVKPDPPPQGYVGSAVCAECHTDVSRRYAEHPMGQALASVLEARQIENYDDVSFSPGGSRGYRVEKTDEGRVLHHEILSDPDGEVVYDQAVPVRYALGSGTRGRSYVADRGGLLYLSPISWYSGKDRWDLAPGYLPDSHRRFDRRATDACLACHSGRVAHERGTPDRYGEPPFLEEAIGCERCHGPGKDHVAHHRLGADASLADSIVNPAKLEPDRREAVCYQCHLQGAGRILRFGRTPHDFRAGDRLEDVWAVFVRENGGSEASRAVSQVQQMRSSACFVGSEGRLGCISCHDPHSKPGPAERRSFYDARCLTCHAEQGCSLPKPERLAMPAAGSCISCHMPKLPASDIPHTSQTDHRILRDPAASSPSPSQEAGRVAMFDRSQYRMPPAEVGRAGGLMMASAAEQSGDAKLAGLAVEQLEAVLPAVDDDVETLNGLGKAKRVLRRYDEAIGYWRRALEIDPDHEEVLASLAKACHETGRAADGVATLDRLFAINPWSGDLHAIRAVMLSQLGRIDEAIAAGETALELNPSLRDVYRLLAELHERRGEPEAADHYRRLHARMPPPQSDSSAAQTAVPSEY